MATTEPGTGSFPTMGTSAATLNTAKPERGRLRPRGVPGKGGSDKDMGVKGNRGRTGGSMGATLHPGATLYAQNAAEATEGQRHLLQMPSRASWSNEFRAPAKYGRTFS